MNVRFNPTGLGKDRLPRFVGFMHNGAPTVGPHHLSRPPPLGLALLDAIRGFEVFSGTGWTS
jgi:hypothetical protein